ncbi:MAG: hypothetical protein OXC37_00025 [Bdellovibrionaceae bacterium]|nr:hypothetical protein [Pseudobdellovibrionaceae bacterium]
MKQFILSFMTIAFLTACENSQDFASVAEESNAVLASEDDNHQQDIQNLLSTEGEKKISGKKRQKLDIGETVGQNDLKPEEKPVTHIKVTDEAVKEPDVKKSEPVTHVTVTADAVEPVVELPKLNILFYSKKRTDTCAKRVIRKNYEDFLDGLVDYDWDISFAHYADASKAELMPLKYISGVPYDDNILSKEEYEDKKAKRLFHTALSPDSMDPATMISAPSSYTPKIANPLSGLDQILSSHVREEGHTVVLLFGTDFSYNSTEEWNEFYSNHPHVSVMALAYRSSNLSNLLHALETNHDFTFVPACDDDISFEDVLKEILSVIQD